MALTILLILAVLWLAWSNGANDNFIGVATLYGSRTCSYRSALIWATLATGAGAFVSVSFAHLLVARFSGAGLIDEGFISLELLAAVALAAAITKWLATRLGMPASTTHALTGGLLGAALVANPLGIAWSHLLAGFLLPLALSIVLAVALTLPLYLLLHRARCATGVSHETCVCVGQTAPQPATILANGRVQFHQAAEGSGRSLTLAVDDVDACVQRYAGRVVGVRAQTMVDAMHYLSAASVCFARAVSDTPKVAALLLAGAAAGLPLGAGASLVLVTAAMLLGGWFFARRVAETMSRRITDLNPGQGLAANLVTAGLVLFASRLGLPVSTTQVACGSIFAIGLANGNVRQHGPTIVQIGLTWLVTLPLGLALGAAGMWLIS